MHSTPHVAVAPDIFRVIIFSPQMHTHWVYIHIVHTDTHLACAHANTGVHTHMHTHTHKHTELIRS